MCSHIYCRSSWGCAFCLKGLRLSLDSHLLHPILTHFRVPLLFCIVSGFVTNHQALSPIQLLLLIKQCHSREDDTVITIRVQAGEEMEQKLKVLNLWHFDYLKTPQILQMTAFKYVAKWLLVNQVIIVQS